MSALKCFFFATRMYLWGKLLVRLATKARLYASLTCALLRLLAGLFDLGLRISNHRGHKFPPSLTLLSFKTQIEWPLVLIATTNFPSLFFQLLQYPRQRSSYSAHRAALMTKTVSIFPAFSSRFVDFAVQFCFSCKFSFHEERRPSQVWQWCDFLEPIKMLLQRTATNEIASFV